MVSAAPGGGTCYKEDVRQCQGSQSIGASSDSHRSTWADDDGRRESAVSNGCAASICPRCLTSQATKTIRATGVLSGANLSVQGGISMIIMNSAVGRQRLVQSRCRTGRGQIWRLVCVLGVRRSRSVLRILILLGGLA